MYHKPFVCLLTLLVFSWPNILIAPKYKAVTYFKKEPTRFGDSLILYCNAKCIAHRLNITCLYHPFKFSHLLQLHTHETMYDKKIQKLFSPLICVVLPNKLPNYENTAAKIHIPWEKFNILYFYSLEHPDFLRELKNMIKPIIPLPELNLPKDKITVAVHVRKGGGFDPPLYSEQYYDNHGYPITYYLNQFMVSKKVDYAYSDIRFPKKFPPEQYYIDQIKMLSKMLNDQPLFVYIFTDDANPKRIVNKFNEILQKPNITFGYRESDNRHDANVLEDFFAMTKFDCLIRPDSLFSQAAQLIGKHKIIIYPQKAQWDNNKLIIKKVGIIFHSQPQL